MFTANGEWYLDRALLLQCCNSLLELLPVDGALGVVLLQSLVSCNSFSTGNGRKTYVRLIVDCRNLEVCDSSGMPSGRDLRASIGSGKRLEGPADRTDRLNTP